MIYTVTFNPSLDYIVSVQNFALGKTNRTATERLLPGGKGINVSTVLWNLGIPSTALGFIAGFTGDEIQRKITEIGFACNFISVPRGFSRINVKLKDFDGTEINGKGPELTDEEVTKLFAQLDRLQSGDTLVLAGSIPESLPDSIYRDIMKRLVDRNILFVVDATRELLLNVLEFHPFLIKPNHHELGEIFHATITSREEVLPYAQKLQEMGARNVLLSMSSQGAVLLSETGEHYMLPAPTGKLVNAVGAGDSMVAGFLAGWMERHDYLYALQMGLSAGSASAFSEQLATKNEILHVRQQFD